MRRKPGKLTRKERVYVDNVLTSPTPEVAAEKAGYAHPAQAAVVLQERPAVAAEVRRREMDRMHNELLPAAVDLLLKVINDDKEQTRNRIAASKIVIDRTIGAADAAAAAKEAHELSADELQERIATLRRKQLALSDNARDITPPGSDDPGDAFG